MVDQEALRSKASSIGANVVGGYSSGQMTAAQMAGFTGVITATGTGGSAEAVTLSTVTTGAQAVRRPEAEAALAGVPPVVVEEEVTPENIRRLMGEEIRKFNAGIPANWMELAGRV